MLAGLYKELIGQTLSQVTVFTFLSSISQSKFVSPAQLLTNYTLEIL